MVGISESITQIKDAEKDADSLVEQSKIDAKAMIDDANVKANEIVETAKNEALEEANSVINEAEENAKKKAKSISSKSYTDVNVIKTDAMKNVDEAASIIVKKIL